MRSPYVLYLPYFIFAVSVHLRIWMDLIHTNTHTHRTEHTLVTGELPVVYNTQKYSCRSQFVFPSTLPIHFNLTIQFHPNFVAIASQLAQPVVSKWHHSMRYKCFMGIEIQGRIIFREIHILGKTYSVLMYWQSKQWLAPSGSQDCAPSRIFWCRWKFRHWIIRVRHMKAAKSVRRMPPMARGNLRILKFSIETERSELPFYF